jgi:hypothetical protein
VNEPSPLTFPYRPAPTLIVSPADAFSIAWLIDLQGVAAFPQLALSVPSLVTRHVTPAAQTGAANARSAVDTPSKP